MADQFIDLHYPLAGIDLAWGFDRQPNRQVGDGQYGRTTPVAINVRSFDPTTDRARGGQRPGTIKYLSNQINGSNSVQCLSSVVVTQGIVPGSGTSVAVYLGAVAGSVLTTFNSSNGVQAASETLTRPANAQLSTRAFISGGSNASYTTLDIADGSGVAVALSPATSSAAVAQYAMAVNGRDLASSPFTTPGTSTDYYTTTAIPSSTLHILAGLQRGASEGKLVLAGIDDTGLVSWSHLTNATSETVLPSTGFYQNSIALAISSTLLCINIPGATGVAKCALADGTSYSVMKTNAQIATEAGGSYANQREADSFLPSCAAAGDVLAVCVASVAGGDCNHGLVFIQPSTGGFLYTALTGLQTSPVLPVSEGRSVAKVVSDGTDFYVVVMNYTANGGTYNAVATKVDGTAGTVLWTTTLTGANMNSGLNLTYLSGLTQLLVVGVNSGYSKVLNATTGAIAGAGPIPKAAALCGAGSLTPGAASIDTGTATGPLDVVYGVSAGTVAVAYGGSFRTVIGGTSALSTTAPVIRAFPLFGYLYFVDGVNYKRVNPSTNTVESWTASAGSLPVDGNGNTPRLGCGWRGRAVLSALESDNRNYFMSRQGDATDFDYSGGVSPDATQALAGNNGRLGLVGDVVTALIPYSDDMFIFGCASTIHVLQGDPNFGGTLGELSNQSGIAFGDAWCRDSGGALYFFSNHRGVYRLEPGSRPVRISQSIDASLRNVNLAASTIRMQWNQRFQGFDVYVTPTASAQATTHYTWESRMGAWTEMELPVSQNPLACHVFNGNAGGEQVALIGSWDGYVRTFTAEAGSDDGTAIDSEVWIGPYQTKDFDEVLVKELQGIIGLESGPVRWSHHCGPTADAALRSTASTTGVWTATSDNGGRNLSDDLRRADHAHFIKLTASNPWSMEAIRMSVVNRGRVRRRGA